MRMHELVRERCKDSRTLLLNLDRETVELVPRRKAVEKVFGGLGFIAIDIGRNAISFDRLCSADAEYNLTDISKVSGLSTYAVTRLISAGAITASIREPGNTNADRARLFSRLDLFVAATLGSLRRKNVSVPNVVRAGRFLRELLATAPAPAITHANDASTVSPVTHNASELVAAGN